MLAAGVLAAIALAASTSGTLSAYTATLRNYPNTASTASITMTQGPNATTQNCTSSTTSDTVCATDLYAADRLRPGDTTGGQKVVFTNAGSVPASSFTLKPGACNGAVATSNTMCNFLLVTVTWTVGGATTTVFSKQTAMTIANKTYDITPGLTAKQNGTMTVTVSLDSAAPNDSQAQSMNQSLLWTFTA